MSSPDNVDGAEEGSVPINGQKDDDSSQEAQENSKGSTDVADDVETKSREDDTITENSLVPKDDGTEVKETLATNDLPSDTAQEAIVQTEEQVREKMPSSSTPAASETDSTKLEKHVEEKPKPSEDEEKAKVSDAGGETRTAASDNVGGEEKHNIPGDGDEGKSTEEMSNKETEQENVATVERTNITAQDNNIDETAVTSDDVVEKTKDDNAKAEVDIQQNTVKQEEVVIAESGQAKDQQEAEQAISQTISETISEHLDSARGPANVEVQEPSEEQKTYIEGQSDVEKGTTAITSETATAKEAESQPESANAEDKETTEKPEVDSDNREVMSKPDTSTSEERKTDDQPEVSQRPQTGENEQKEADEKSVSPTTVGSEELVNVADNQSCPQTSDANNFLSPSQSFPPQSVSPRLESGLDTALPDDPQTGRAESAMTDSSFFSVTPFDMRPYVPTPTPDIIQDYKIPTPEVATTPALSEEMSRQLRRSSEMLSSRESERAALDSQGARNFDLTGEGIDEEEEEVEITEGQHNVSPEPSEVFTTAVSEETIQEAMGRQHQQVGEGVLGMWGHLSKEPFGDVIGTKSLEHYYRGIQCAKDGKFEDALVDFSKAINLRPQDADAYVQRGEIYLWMCDFQSAILNYKKACTIRINSSELYSRLAFIYYFQGQTFFDQQLYAEALESFTRAAEIRPDVIGYHTRSVACLAALHRYGECLALVNQRLEEERDNADLYIMRARLHELFRNSTLCYYDVKDALSLDPEQPEAQAMLAKLERKAEDYHNHACQLSINGKSNEALQKISMAIETNPSIPEFHVLRGATHRRLGDFNSAIDDYLLALDKTDHNEQDPTYMEGQRQLLLTYNDFAVECFQKGFYDEAIILLNKAIKGEKREKGLYINRGDCFFRQGDLHFALADYHQALELDPEDWAVRSRIAVVHSEFGVLDYEERNYQESETRFSLAIQNNPKVARFYVYRARARYMMENIRGAREDILMSLHLDPSSDEILSILSRLFPGKSVGEVMKSKAAKAAKLTLDQMLYMAAAPSHRLPPVDRSHSAPELSLAVDSSEDMTDKGTQVSEEPYVIKDMPKKKKATIKGPFPASKAKRPPILPDLKMCMEERDFHLQIAKGKKKITIGLKKVLKERKPLKYKGARLRRLPPPTRTKSAESDEPSVSQWRNIQPKVGLGLLDG
ncbi:tetratricopeptide repeat protein 16-like [Branchiostoma floridae]|uniref:Tetratricopeptide repeat protein 16-like n=1 Tax=Branchiostoma floridae TaxID=7739 RepID=A0A9J7LKL2_BRAFL|nr:tetratricopeptide repeat protein 16-like [Branchiostoma floridae]XP_035684639.1 tetratricopeptide repeat protein 16-like [Branchiostoma floridae]XP_035684640.1 tetratricopeptide repeat protein 16-like [Branchiostoma floridae]XP_035684641.1 tetratricopeptide repeat protein 16-like [Branchiostoma floridae]